ncbi:HAD family hydrolase [Vibrio sp. F74]|uniref:HAD family hydrolase n=1 Tax=Vibrio sp. F74 TaxID=700020 RepID=UPI0035F55F81
MNIKAVLFDMDGLIFDTECLYKTSWQEAAKDQGLEISDEFYEHFIGVQDPECEELLTHKFSHSLDLTRYRHIRDQHIHKAKKQGIRYKTGFHTLFKMLQGKGIMCALVTSSHRPEVYDNFAHSNYLNLFSTIVTAEDVGKGKPNPECYLLACKILNIEPMYALILEDSNNGMKAGIDAGCKTVMIPDLLPPRNDIEAEADHVLSSLEDVIYLLS